MHKPFLLGIAILITSAVSVACTTLRPVTSELVKKETSQQKAVESLGGQSPVFWANMRVQAWESANAAAGKWNIVCEDGFGGAARCFSLMAKVVVSVELQRILDNARILGVRVIASDNFMYSDGWVAVDTNASVDQIVSYLLHGKVKEKQGSLERSSSSNLSILRWSHFLPIVDY